MRLVFLTLLAFCMPAFAQIEMAVDVDATDLPRKLLRARMSMPADSGEMAVWYPKWVPGIHGPRNAIENMGELRFFDGAGNRLEWTRDPAERYRFLVSIPDGVDALVAEMTYITSQPTTNSRGVDSYGNSMVGAINWNTIVLYPEDVVADDIQVTATLVLPEGWKHASALSGAKNAEGQLGFSPVSLETLVDSPLIAGEHLRSFDLDVEEGAPVFLDAVSESSSAVLLEADLLEKYSNMASEAALLFGGCHFETYRLLVVCSDDLPSTGLEHLASSFNGVGERDLFSAKKLRGWVGYLLPHEFAHSWCGKKRRPAGMATPDFHTNKATNVLWFYEGLTQYLGHVLVVRSGLWEPVQYREQLADTVTYYMRQRGREWRSLEDTAADSFHLRARTAAWSRLRRNQDYYNEGALFWLEADARIRTMSDGERSLDDFCRAVMGPDIGDGVPVPITRQQIVDALSDLADFSWDDQIADRIEQPRDALALDFVELLGYRIEYATQRSDYLRESEETYGYVSAEDSLGANFGGSGRVYSDLVPGMPAEAAGLAPGMDVIGVNGRTFSAERMRDAIADSPVRGDIELLVTRGDVIETIRIDYADGPKYLRLVRNPDAPDILADIMAPRLGTK